MKITFIGATNEVTGSKTFFEYEDQKILIDCGLYQEGEENSKLNLDALPFKPSELTAVIVTHAHLDHTGFLPVLYQQGYRGPIYMSLPTSKLARIILEDSAKLMKDTDEPLYDAEDAQKVISLFKPQIFEEPIKLKSLSFKFHKSSHILGAAFVELHAGLKTITFSGDLGRFDDILLGSPSKLNKTNYLIMESTYGDKVRPHSDMIQELKDLVVKAKSESKTILIPCFALHRAQLISYLISKIFIDSPELEIPLYLNSPMMEQVTFAYKKFLHEFTDTETNLNLAWSNLKFLDHYWDIEKVNNTQSPQIIIASSGMVTGGRIWSHLLTLSKRNDVILFLPGFQAPGTPGHDLINGKRNITSPTGEEVIVQCEILYSGSFSSHGDQNDLINWVQSAHQQPDKIFLVHGEQESKKALADKLCSMEYNTTIPKHLETFEL